MINKICYYKKRVIRIIIVRDKIFERYIIEETDDNDENNVENDNKKKDESD